MRGFQAASFTLSDKAETIFKKFQHQLFPAIMYCDPIQNYIDGRGGEKQYPDRRSAWNHLFDCQHMAESFL